MLYLSVDDNIELMVEEFKNYVQDDWDWKTRWMSSNSGYMTKSPQ